MKLFNLLPLVFSLQAAAAAGTKDEKVQAFGKTRPSSNTKSNRKLAGKGGKSTPTVFNLTTFHKYHHFGFWFLMVHDETVGPLYTPNEPAIAAMEPMCEAGDPADLEIFFEGEPGVFSAEGRVGALFGQNWEGLITEADGEFGIGDIQFEFDVPSGALVTIVGMIANSNDGCIILDGVTAEDGDVHFAVEIDAGTEANDEVCGNLAGCAGLPFDNALNCPCGDQGNTGSQADGEGFMSNHDGLGLQNGGLLAESDWRAPMVVATVSTP